LDLTLVSNLEIRIEHVGIKDMPKFPLKIKNPPLFSDACSESGTVWGLSGKVTEHIVTYIFVPQEAMLMWHGLK
jgi:hypothetical protein